MAFSPNTFLSNIKGRGGLARPNRFDVIIPIPTYVNLNVSNSVVDRFKAGIDAFKQSIRIDLSTFRDVVLGADPPDAQNKSSNADTSRWLASQCEAAEIPGRKLATQKVKIYGPSFQVPYAWNTMT
jgi:hypothetical protein